jgi:hypothetical protein
MDNPGTGDEMSVLRRLRNLFQGKQEDFMTKTGETFHERAAYRDRGELSPGEIATARAIRAQLIEAGWIDHNGRPLWKEDGK